MRTIAVGKDEHGVPRPLLNGQPIMLPGALDQGYWPDGIYTAPTDAALRFDIEAAKQLGLVAIRKHVKVEPERYYYWADRLGLLILQDLPSGREGDPFTDLPTSPEAASTCEMERRLLIQSRWNHPSIIAWVLFNEGWGQHDTLRHASWARQLDPTRLIDEASGFPRHGGGDIHDTHGGDAPQDGRRICLDSETAGFGLAALGHSWPGQLWATGTYDPQTGGEIAAQELYPVEDASKTGSRNAWSASIATRGPSARAREPAATSKSSCTMSRRKQRLAQLRPGDLESRSDRRGPRCARRAAGGSHGRTHPLCGLPDNRLAVYDRAPRGEVVRCRLR